jgi:hypothetical protein
MARIAAQIRLLASACFLADRKLIGLQRISQRVGKAMRREAQRRARGSKNKPLAQRSKIHTEGLTRLCRGEGSGATLFNSKSLELCGCG